MSVLSELLNGETFLAIRTAINDNFTALNADKVEKVAGKGLSENDYTDAESAKLAGIEAGATADDASSIIAKIGTAGKIDPSYLPSYVDDVVEAANYAALPGTGETGKVYVTIDNNYTYRWSGSVYVEIKDSGETAASLGVLINSAGDATPNDSDFIATALSGGATRRISWTNAKVFLKSYFDSVAQTFSNKTIDNTNVAEFKVNSFTLQDPTDPTKQVIFQVSSVSAGTTRTFAFPNSSQTLVGTTVTQTLTNKRVTKRCPAVTQSATPTINTDVTDVAHITGLAQAITSFTTNLTGTPDEGDMLRIDITDNWTARAITWGAKFEASTAALPTTTVVNTRLDVVFVWNSVTSKWRCVGVS